MIQVAAGTSLMDGRLHVLGSLEYHDEKGVGPGEYGLRLAGGRDWFTQRTLVNRNVLNDGFITNLPGESCVEVPVFADRMGLHPVRVGRLRARSGGPA